MAQATVILRELYLYPDLVEYPDEVTVPFRQQTRCLCNYLERHTKPLKFRTPNFGRICVIGSSSAEPHCFVNSSKVLEARTAFEVSEYEKLEVESAELQEFFIGLLSRGLEETSKHVEIPLDAYLEGIALFREGGYLNTWVHQTKSVRKLGVKCSLECRLTMTAFHLSFVVRKSGELVWEREILNTYPDEIVFVPAYDEIKLNGTRARVTDRSKRTFFEVDLASELSLEKDRLPFIDS